MNLMDLQQTDSCLVFIWQQLQQVQKSSGLGATSIKIQFFHHQYSEVQKRIAIHYFDLGLFIYNVTQFGVILDPPLNHAVS